MSRTEGKGLIVRTKLFYFFAAFRVPPKV